MSVRHCDVHNVDYYNFCIGCNVVDQPATTPVVADPTIDPDVFAYDGSPMTQCISGFGRNAVATIGADLRREPADDREMHKRLAWHVGELVRWCQHFNEKSQRLAASLVATERGHQTDRARLVLLEKLVVELRAAAEPWHAAGGACNTDHNAHRRAAEHFAEIVGAYEYADGTPPRPVLDLATVDGDIVLFCAMRYALGRQTYVVSSVIAAVRLALPTMSLGRRKTLARDIREAEREGRLGAPTIDAPGWQVLAEELEAEA